VPAGERPGRLRVVEERSDGVVLYGAKPGTSVGVQAHLGIIHTLLSPGIDPEATIFSAVPMNAPGITHVLREPVTRRAPAEDHPIGVNVGEESDALMIFDRVFVPWELIFTFRRQELLNKYHEIGRLPLWHIMTRIAYKAQIFAGAAQLIVDVLGTDQIPQVRDLVAEVTAYAETMMAFVIAAEETGEVRSGIFVPNSQYITVGRLYSITEYPRILQILRELSGQGLISRFTKAQWERPDIGAKLDEFLPGTGVSARDKNRLFNFVWDLTSSEAALRTALFENVNATPAAAMRGRIYAAHDRSEWVRFVKEFAGMDLGEER
jgi:4-hydroxyphenylacetate 3-monooxygenase